VSVICSDTSTQAISIALDLSLTHILNRRLALAQGQLPVVPDPNPNVLELTASVVYDPVRLVFSDN
jgi:hypothetical protein